MTAWIISLGDLSGVLSYSSQLPGACVIVGVAIHGISKKKKLNAVGNTNWFGLCFRYAPWSIRIRFKRPPRFQEVFSSLKIPF